MLKPSHCKLPYDMRDFFIVKHAILLLSLRQCLMRCDSWDTCAHLQHSDSDNRHLRHPNTTSTLPITLTSTKWYHPRPRTYNADRHSETNLRSNAQTLPGRSSKHWCPKTPRSRCAPTLKMHQMLHNTALYNMKSTCRIFHEHCLESQ